MMKQSGNRVDGLVFLGTSIFHDHIQPVFSFLQTNLFQATY